MFCVLCFVFLYFYILLLFECPIWVVSKPSTLIEKNEKIGRASVGKEC